MTVDPIIAWSVRLALAALLLAAAWHKLSDRSRFRGTVRAYSLLPPTVVPAFAVMLPLAEIVVAVSLLGSASPRPAGVATASLLTLYTLALVINLARGRRDLDCGCFAASNAVPIGVGLVARNLVLVAVSLTLLLPMRSRALVWIDWVTLGTTVLALSLLWGAAQHLARTTPRARRLGGAR